MMRKAAKAGRAMRMHVDPLELLLEDRGKAPAATAPGIPSPRQSPPLRPIRTGLEEHSQEIAEAHERLRLAAGAESMSPSAGCLCDFTDQMELKLTGGRSDEPASASFLRLMEE
jgi:hypothetical protein